MADQVQQPLLPQGNAPQGVPANAGQAVHGAIAPEVPAPIVIVGEAELLQQIQLTSKVQESVSKSQWADFDKKSALSNEVYLQSLISSVQNASQVIRLICMNNVDWAPMIETYMGFFTMNTTIATAVDALSQNGPNQFGLRYRQCAHIRTFDMALSASLFEATKSHEMTTQMDLAARSYHADAGIGNKSGLLLFLTIKKQLRGESEVRTDEARRFIQDTQTNGQSNRPVRTGQILSWLSTMRDHHTLVNVHAVGQEHAITEAALVQETLRSLVALFPVSSGFDTLGSRLNDYLNREQAPTWEVLYRGIDSALNSMRAHSPWLFQEPYSKGALDPKITYSKAPAKKQQHANQQQFANTDSAGSQNQNGSKGKGKGKGKNKDQVPKGGKESHADPKKKKGPPSNSRDPKKSQTSNTSNPHGFPVGTCFKCGSPDHYANECPVKGAKGTYDQGKKKKGGKGGKVYEYIEDQTTDQSDSNWVQTTSGQWVQAQANSPPAQSQWVQTYSGQWIQAQSQANPSPAQGQWVQSNSQPWVQSVPQPKQQAASAGGWTYIPIQKGSTLQVPGSGGIPQQPAKGGHLYRANTYKMNSFAVLAAKDEDGIVDAEDEIPDFFIDTGAGHFDYPGASVTPGSFESKLRKKKKAKGGISKTLKGVAQVDSQATNQDVDAAVQSDLFDRARDSIRRAIIAKRSQVANEWGGYYLLDSGANLSNFSDVQEFFRFEPPKVLSTMNGTISLHFGSQLRIGDALITGTYNQESPAILAECDLISSGFSTITLPEDLDQLPGSKGTWLITPQNDAVKLTEFERLSYIRESDIHFINSRFDNFRV